ncbi:MAG: ABC transporter substrate-binding protein [Actinomycetota bacterium]|nr:MAG: ABC transporter substrate-binding protein [Actinomycetota bacterium]
MKRTWIAASAVLALLVAACTGGGGGTTGPTGGTGGGGEEIHLVMWMGYTPPPPVEESLEYLSIERMVKEFEQAHPNITIELQYVNSDNALQKATVALQGNQQPDISYQYGTNMPQLATSPKLVDLTEMVSDPEYDWEDFYEGERAVATVNGRVYGVPALVDNLAVVYNKDLFAKAGLPEPTNDWTWDDLRAAAKAITDPKEKIFGLVFPADASETMVWQYIAMLWAAGGDILNEDHTEAIFNQEPGVRALQTLVDLANDGSLYLDYQPDSGKYGQLFNAGKIGMVITGPWDLAGFPDVNYGVVFMPSFEPGGSHETIAGPDNWVIFDNGPERVQAAWEFVKFMTSPEQVLRDSLDTGHMPTRASVAAMPEFQEFYEKYPGTEVFVENLQNVLKARPQIPQYPRISSALGQALVSAITGKATPQEALDQAAEQANGFLAVPA